VGFAPALRLMNSDLRTLINEVGRGGSAGRARSRIFGALVVAEIALAVVLVVGAGLLVRSFFKLQAGDPGFKPDRIVSFELSLPQASYADFIRVGDFYRNLLDRIRTIRGVESV